MKKNYLTFKEGDYILVHPDYVAEYPNEFIENKPYQIDFVSANGNYFLYGEPPLGLSCVECTAAIPAEFTKTKLWKILND